MKKTTYKTTYNSSKTTYQSLRLRRLITQLLTRLWRLKSRLTTRLWRLISRLITRLWRLISPLITRLWRLISQFINYPFPYSRVADRGLNRESNSKFKMEDRNELIKHYFNLNLGYQQKEILSCLLLIHDQNLSSRQFSRILARCNLTLTLQPATCKLHPLFQKTLKNSFC